MGSCDLSSYDSSFCNEDRPLQLSDLPSSSTDKTAHNRHYALLNCRLFERVSRCRWDAHSTRVDHAARQNRGAANA